jgi:hypothetical protein
MFDYIFVFDDGECIVAEHSNESGDVVWSEAYDTIEDVRTAYADHAAAGKYQESTI